MNKKITLLLVSSFLSFASMQSKAETFIVEVEDNEFSPAIINLNLGDTIYWIWDEGTHTTTSTLIPPGANPWSASIEQTSPAFMYVPTVTGSYDYECYFHGSMGMLGHFTVTATTNINDADPFSGLRFQNPILGEQIKMNVSNNKDEIKIQLMSLTGEITHNFIASGNGQMIFPVDGISPGIYILNVTNGRHSKSYRLIKEH